MTKRTLIIKMILILIAIGLLSFTSWFLYQTNRENTRSITNHPGADKKGPGNEIQHGTTEADECAKNGIIIVAFNNSVSKARQAEIINIEKTSVKNEFISINGYSLNVTKGEEQKVVNAFLKYAEIKYAELNRCGSVD